MKGGGSGEQLDWAKLQAPPYLLGVTLVFWGFLSGHVLLGLAAGLVIEGHRWFSWRWSFSDQDYIRVWNLCVALFLIVAVFQVVDHEAGRWEVTRVFQTWMPILFLPMMWAQNFSSGPVPPFLTFSLVARRKRLYDERAGRKTRSARRVDLSCFYFAVLLLSIGAVGRRAPEMAELIRSSSRLGFGEVSIVYVIVAVLLTWALIAFIPRRAWIMAGVLILLASYAGHHVHGGLRALHGFVESKALEWITGGSGNPHRSLTRFGDVGEIKLSSKVFWRAKSIEGPRPRLLPEAVYRAFSGRIWHNGNRDLSALELENQNQWEIEPLAVVDSTGVMEIRGHAVDREQLLPRLDDTALIFDLEASALLKNHVGTLVAHPEYSSIKYTLYSGAPPRPGLEAFPDHEFDLYIERADKPEIEETVAGFRDSLGETSRQRINAVERFFAAPANGFKYTQYLSDIGVSDNRRSRSFIGSFLDPKGRRGHCEYFATATVLLLRALDIPARYVVGYSMEEYDSRTKEFLLRGIHRHAWARAWIEEENRWINVDTTPANWMEFEERPLSKLQQFRDQWDYWMLSWNLWRRDDNKGLLWTLLPLLLAGGLLIVVVLRLVRGLRKSRHVHRPDDGADDADRLGMDSVWYELEKALTEHHWPRPPSQNLTDWCRQLVTVQPAWRETLPLLVKTHYRYRFDPEGITDEEKRHFVDSAGEFQDGLLRHKTQERPRTT